MLSSRINSAQAKRRTTVNSTHNSARAKRPASANSTHNSALTTHHLQTR
ncbi:hypothetical protein ACQFX9_25365 [Aliinostoc sp. HNIBRCY26]